MWDETVAWFLLKFKDWGLLLMSVTSSSVALSMGLGWLVIFRRVIFSGVTSLVIANVCYAGFQLEYSISFACGYFISFFIESAFRQRLDAVGRALGAKAVSIIHSLPFRKGDGDQNGD